MLGATSRVSQPVCCLLVCYSNSVITLVKLYSTGHSARERGQFLLGQLRTAQRATDAAGIDAAAAAAAALAVQ